MQEIVKLTNTVANMRDQYAYRLFGKCYRSLDINSRLLIDQYIGDLMHPQWRPITIGNKDTGYSVSNVGDIVDGFGNSVKLYTNNSGYLTVRLRNVNANKKWTVPKLVHRLVAEAFVDNPCAFPEVNHIISDPKFNWYRNLEWVTHKQNIRHSIDLGHQIVGMRHKNAKCTDGQIRIACQLLADNKLTLREVSIKSGVPIRTLKHIRFDNGWHHITKDYEIPTTLRRNGPRFSELSLMIKTMIESGFTNEEIYSELEKSGLGSDVSKKSLSDRIYHIRRIIKSN